MRATKVVKLQRLLICGLLIFFAVVFIWEQKIFNDQMDTIDSYEELVEIPRYSYSYDEVILLAKVVQCEAGTYSEAPDSQKMVCQVILNRVAAKDFPNNITDVVYQKNQFAVTTNGSLEKCVLEPETLANVYEVLLYGTDLPSYVKYFYAGYLDTGWITTLPVYDRMQGTVFAYEIKDKEGN